MPFKILEESATVVYLSEIEGDEKRSRAPGAAADQDSQPPQPPPSDEGPQDPQAAVAMDTE